MTSYALPNYLRFDPESGRYALAGRDLHCGDCFQVRFGKRWENVRIEFTNQGWYLVGLPYDDIPLEGLEARWP